MSDVQSPDYAAVLALLAPVMQGESSEPLEQFLMERSQLPGVRMNLVLISTFADVVRDLIAPPNTPSERLEMLVDAWAAIPVGDAPTNHPRVILPSIAVMTYGQAAVTRPEWWDDEIAKLYQAAADPRWRVRDQVTAALQRMLVADWNRACAALVGWASNGEPLVVRAAVLAVAEPSILRDKARAEDALAVQAEGVNRFMNIPDDERRKEESRALRQALGYTLSIVTAESPETGFHLMEELAALPDPDIIWIVRENMKKKRLQPWQDRLQTLEIALFRPEEASDD